MNPFISGFALGMIGFAIVNVIAHFYYPYGAPEVRPIVQYYGFPFVIWTKSGLTQPLNGMALCADIAIAAVFSMTLGLLWRRRVSA